MNRFDWTTSQWIEYYDKLSNKNYMAYQESGLARYENAYIKYEQIADAFRAKAGQEKESGADMKKRMNNKNFVVERLIPGKDYSYDEVVKLLNDAVWW